MTCVIPEAFSELTIAHPDQPPSNPLAPYEQEILNKSLRISARQNNLDNLTNALRKGADINGASQDGITALMYASRRCHPKVARYLIDSGADINATNQRGYTALILAVRAECLPVVTALTHQPTLNYNHRDTSGKSAEDYARAAISTEVDGPTFKILNVLRTLNTQHIRHPR